MNKTTFSAPEKPGGLGSRVIHIQAGFNGSKKDLGFHALAGIIGQAAAFGYNAINISGGEPFLYSSLEELVRFSKSAGYYNSATTGGLLLKGSRAKKILKYMDLVAVTIDGKEQMHDRMWMQPGAFKKMRQGIAVLKDSITKYGFFHILRADSCRILSWLAGFAVDEKASLLHLHPLQTAGKLLRYIGALRLNQSDLYNVYLSYDYLKIYYENDIFIQLDLLHRNDLKNNRLLVVPETSSPWLSAGCFSTIFKELIINEHGDILPLAHTCSSFFTIGNIYSGEKLEHMIKRFMYEKMGAVIDIYQAVYNEIMNDRELEVINWSDMVMQKTYSLFPVVAA
jgi:MoaA/NifB/PqqE/SkfB family radical SAM enzyme